uniref:Uncharacterized protein n=1 Tax=Globodera rostochiensis TaxID=31243 RepID=A0A914H2I4_GLORO
MNVSAQIAEKALGKATGETPGSGRSPRAPAPRVPARSPPPSARQISSSASVSPHYLPCSISACSLLADSYAAFHLVDPE